MQAGHHRWTPQALQHYQMLLTVDITAHLLSQAIDAKDHSSLAINEVQLLQELGAAHNTSATASPATKAAPPLATSATSSAAPAQIHAQASSATSTTVSMGMPAAGVSTQQHSGPPGIVQLLGTFLHTLPSGQQYRCLVLERLGSTAAEVLAYLGSRSKGKARRGMSTPALKNMTRQLLLALDHCHRYLSPMCAY